MIKHLIVSTSDVEQNAEVSMRTVSPVNVVLAIDATRVTVAVSELENMLKVVKEFSAKELGHGPCPVEEEVSYG